MPEQTISNPKRGKKLMLYGIFVLLIAFISAGLESSFAPVFGVIGFLLLASGKLIHWFHWE
jgi:hypothetical protein